jgi:hypothetical protein
VQAPVQWISAMVVTPALVVTLAMMATPAMVATLEMVVLVLKEMK